MSDENVFQWLPCSVVFLSTAHGDQRDIMTATAMFVSEKNPQVVISVAKDHLSEKLIKESGKFTIVIAGQGQKQLAMQLGSTKGDVVNKFEKFSIASVGEPACINCCIPEGSAAWLACEVEGGHDIEGYRIFIGRVVEQNDLGNPPLIWQKNKFFGLTPS